MADQKGRSVTFNMPGRIAHGNLKAGIGKEIHDKIVVFQDLGDGVYLLELESRSDAETLVNNCFNF